MTSIIDFGNLIWFDKDKIFTLFKKYPAKIVGSSIFNDTVTFACATKNEKLSTVFSYKLDKDTLEFNDTPIHYKNNTIQSLKHIKTLITYEDYTILFTCKKIVYWNNNEITDNSINNTKTMDYQKLMNNIIISINNIFSTDKHIKYLSIDGISIDTKKIYLGIGVAYYKKYCKSKTEVIIVRSDIKIENNEIHIGENFEIIDYVNLNIVAKSKSLPIQRLSDIHFDRKNKSLYVLTYNCHKGYLWKYAWYDKLDMFNTIPSLVTTIYSTSLVFNQIPSSITKIKDNYFLITFNHQSSALNINNFDYLIIKD